jgi:hypothetical protein
MAPSQRPGGGGTWGGEGGGSALAAGDRGQGTVEYVALILLVAVVLAGVVAATKKTNLGSGDIGKAIMEKIKGAIDDVSK